MEACNPRIKPDDVLVEFACAEAPPLDVVPVAARGPEVGMPGRDKGVGHSC